MPEVDFTGKRCRRPAGASAPKKRPKGAVSGPQEPCLADFSSRVPGSLTDGSYRRLDLRARDLPLVEAHTGEWATGFEPASRASAPKEETVSSAS